MKFKPLYDRVLVRRVEEEKVSKGGIVIPDAAREKPLEGVIIAVGIGRATEDGVIAPMLVQSGDRVLFGKYQGSEIKIEGEDFILLRESDLLGVFR